MKKEVVLLIFVIFILSVGCYHDKSKNPDKETKSPFITDWCDDDPKSNVDFISYSSGSFTLHYLPGTAAERDREDILNKRNSVLATIENMLDIKEDRIIDIYMTPNRRAAKLHNVGAGAASPVQGRIEVLYLDDPQSYEQTRYGHEVTHVVAYNIDPYNRFHLNFIEEGLAEFFDHSGRDYHQVFVQVCKAFKLDLAAAIQLNKDDVYGRSYTKAASFIQTLFDIDPDADKFKAFFSGCYIYLKGNYPYSPDGQLIDADKLIEIIDSQLKVHYGITFEEFNKQWLDNLTPLVNTKPLRLAEDDLNEIKQLFTVRDQAMSEGNAELYRSTMEGFYCDTLSDSERMSIAEQTISKAAAGKSRVIDAFYLTIKNYAWALVYFEKTVNGKTEILKAFLEHYPLGWRFNRVEDELGRGYSSGFGSTLPEC
ncbi:MAG: hypothetical protein GTO45_26170 [Candidatus Aminicenantes bacterium]|nr:hypothetical protein [Candidatus Aminicenantes bacterium]NIN21625.1 hypothetical protein [Candidatus Aminicenantes bacterium]NIN88257.1 hypothetical protein [Candidatus Aminicenantes bacterium]NIO84620.1 hypothetical protein [Candidatus Aminicenantes bacterium]NIQ70560.1 hypothetical protein [Candidatus Aminicenantes bacterium]